MADNVLDRIMTTKRREIAEAKARVPADALRERLSEAPPVRGFADAVAAASPLGLIAEVKKASPSAGLIRADFDPVSIARTYESHGASCLSVLTDETYFQGHLDFLRAIRREVSIPVMRKEFVLDPYQVLEARAAGADAVLLIAECLDDGQLRGLYDEILGLGMDALIEIYEPENLDRVLALRPRLLGVNNRNLKTMVTDLRHTTDLKPRIPDSVLLVAESGIRTSGDVRELADAGIRGILVGESLMRQADIGAAVDALLADVR